MLVIDNRDRRRADPKNIGKCTYCKRHLIQEEVLEHFAKYHHSEWVQIVKKCKENDII